QVMIWAWADDARKWTPNFGPLDGQNGSADRRLQRYIAARLGPLPGWSMSYGFDLDEWATEAEVQSWAAFLNDEMGWEHLLWARERSNSDLDAVSNDFRPDGNPVDEFYQLAVAELDASQGRPVIFERRFAYLRDGVWTDEKTRQAMWQFTIAGGAAGWFGFFPGSTIADPGPYSNPEELRTHAAFWKDRLLIDMERQNGLTPDSLAWALATPDFDNIVIYAMDTDEIQLNLSGLTNPFFAILVDTETDYAEIDLGILNPSDQILDLSSFGQARDWALVLTEVLPGDFDLDGDVDGADFLKWQREGLGASALTLWKAQFGDTNTPPAAASVPEPSSVGTLLLGVLITLGVPRCGQNVMK
ncbi:MAG: hypothetical protein GXP26_05390, partial [Planctomycetes bacterium]|nr:hypothetical protein [Planctomycetota bacterium]